MKSLAKLTRFNLLYLIGVILWGAYVRATGSGAGCGDHWPLCNGQVIPRAPEIQTLIEFTHRLTSGLSLIFMGWMVWVAFRVTRPGHPVRQAAAVSMGFLIIEALIGAGLVLLGLVADNVSVARAVAMGLHLVNTLLLLGAVTWTLWLAEERPAPRLAAALAGPESRKSAWLGLACILAFLLVGLSGAIAALGDTLFPASSLTERIHGEPIPAIGQILIQLRVFHPAIAVASAMLILFLARQAWNAPDEARPFSAKLAGWVMAGVFAQMLIGAVNVLLLAPVWLQLVHLLVADALWIGLVYLILALITETAEEHATVTVSFSLV